MPQHRTCIDWGLGSLVEQGTGRLVCDVSRETMAVLYLTSLVEISESVKVTAILVCINGRDSHTLGAAHTKGLPQVGDKRHAQAPYVSRET